MKNILSSPLLGLSLPLPPISKAKVNNWHHWRGPDATGAPAAKPPTIGVKIRISSGRFPLMDGSASPIIWGNKVFILTAINTKSRPSLPKPEDQPKRIFGMPHHTEYVCRYVSGSKTGKTLWQQVATRLFLMRERTEITLLRVHLPLMNSSIVGLVQADSFTISMKKLERL